MKKIIFTLFVLFLTGCGFRPMYSGTSTDIYVTPISGINGIDLRNALWAKFGGQHSSDAKYTLIVDLDEPVTQYKALEQTGDATWQEVSLIAKYSLLYDGKQIASGTERVAESYTFVSYLVASNAAYNNAVQNAIRVLSEEISARAIAETYKYENESADK
jgi:hypothetical protein